MIASIYIKSHEYLIKSPQTLNLGGKFIYNFCEDGTQIIIKRKTNEKYIPEFFKITKSKCEIVLLSAIVGENGVGKSTILDIIRRLFIKDKYAMPNSEIIAIVEINNETKILHTYSTNIKITNEKFEIIPTTILTKDEQKEYQSIYYSPHLDLKYNFNFDDVDNYDISLDQLIKQDFKDIEKKGANENGIRFELQEELVFKNSMRQINFLNSDIYKNNNVFKKTFNIPQYETGILNFREYNRVLPHNTPLNLRTIIETIQNKVEEERRKWPIIQNKSTNLQPSDRKLAVDKHLLKLYIISAFMSMVIQQMEKHNSWLNEGVIEGNYNMVTFNNSSAIETFKYFIKNSKIEYLSTKKQIFNHELILSFWRKINDIIDRENEPNNISQQWIRINLNELSEILSLHRNIIINLIYYYPKQNGLTPKQNFIDGFISFRPTDRNMSSGETALLNLFSKFYYFIQNNLIDQLKALPSKKNYILLLDEADLGFHPSWKKKYIKAMLQTLPFFFEDLQEKPKLQIIITTHDPLTLSDIPIKNVVFLQQRDQKCSVLSENDDNFLQKTFGANITDLLAHSFFIDDGLIGTFCKEKIEEIINWINNKKNRSKSIKHTEFTKDLEKYKQTIDLIDEKVIRIKLAEMLDEITPRDSNYFNNIIDKEIQLLTDKKRNNELYRSKS